jgi:hypothetical protein
MPDIMAYLDRIGVLDFHKNKELTLNEEYNVGPQYANCYCHNDLLPVPNGETGGVRECLIREMMVGSGNRTYMRSTIKREEVAMER